MLENLENEVKSLKINSYSVKSKCALIEEIVL